MKSTDKLNSQKGVCKTYFFWYFMMVRLFKRVAEAFDADIARMRLCESSGSEHSPESFTDLSDLVNSFIESDDGDGSVIDGHVLADEKENKEEQESLLVSAREMLKSLLGCKTCSDDHCDGKDVKQMILAEIEAFEGDTSSKAFKRQLMIHLRDKGFDAGLCKSRWERTGSMPSGKYEYVDVNMNGKRYIVEVDLDREFHIARPTPGYIFLLDIFPRTFVSEPEELKQVVTIMCDSMKKLLDNNGLKLAPWRRNNYMQTKWFGSYKRTTNAISTKRNMNLSHEVFGASCARRSVGFEAMPIGTSCIFCREDFAGKTGSRTGNLAAALSG